MTDYAPSFHNIGHFWGHCIIWIQIHVSVTVYEVYCDEWCAFVHCSYITNLPRPVNAYVFNGIIAKKSFYKDKTNDSGTDNSELR